MDWYLPPQALSVNIFKQCSIKGLEYYPFFPKDYKLAWRQQGGVYEEYMNSHLSIDIVKLCVEVWTGG